jgi:NAD(P)-dependent dehydrogenase (short-subunit alcohol dehydrogenase family)
VHHLTRSLTAEWAARSARVNSVAPTYIATELTKQAAADPEVAKHRIGGTPMGRLGQSDEIASAIPFLASGASSLMTGAVVSADGGMGAGRGG